MKNTLLILFLFFASGAACGAGLASDVAANQIPERIEYIKDGIARVRTGLLYETKKKALMGAGLTPGKRWLTYEPSLGFDIEPLDIQFKPSSTLVIQGSPNPNLSPDKARAGQSTVLYLDFVKKLGDWGRCFVRLEPGWGDTVEPKMKLFSNVNHNAHDAGNRFSPRKYWYEQYLFRKQFSVKIGRLRPNDWFDQNHYADDDDTQFLSWMFNNSPAIEWPTDYVPGIHMHLALDSLDYLELDIAHLNGDPKWHKYFEHDVYMAQGTIKSAPLLKLDPKSWAGNYRFYSWLNNRNHAKFVQGSTAPGADGYSNYGFGLSFDQMLGRTLGAFGRFGWERPDVAPFGGGATVEWSWSGGVEVNGKYWKRIQDHISFAVGQNFVSKQYKDAGNPAANEGHIEAYYSFRLNECIAISPDVQMIWNPNGVGKPSRGEDDPIMVYATRFHIVF